MVTVIERPNATKTLDDIKATFFPVKKLRDKDPNNRLGWALYDDNGQKLTEVSDHYNLISNERLIKPFLEEFGPASFTKVQRVNRHFFYEIETGRELEVANGDKLKQRIYIANSYDKLCTYKFLFGAFRLFCLNGMYYGQTDVNFKQRHIGIIRVEDMQSAVIKGYKKQNFDMWRKMAKTPCNEEKQMKFITNFKPYEIEKEAEQGEDQCTNERRNENILYVAKQFRNYRTAPKEGETVWGLYNRMNWAISHGFKTKNINEYIKLNRRVESELVNQFSLN